MIINPKINLLYRLIMMSVKRRMQREWKAELEKVKKATEEEIKEVRRKEEELREKHKGEREKIIEMIYSQLKPVEETFREEGKEETDQPKIKKYPGGISLSLPIVHQQTHTGFSISFDLRLTDKGYAVTTRKSGYDHTTDRVFTSEGFVEAPVEMGKIRSEIRDFIGNRSSAIKMLEGKKRRMQREWG